MSLPQQTTPAEQLDRPPTTDDERAAVLNLVYEQAREVVNCAHKVTCPCGARISLLFAFKCLDCWLWFCQACARRHFGIQPTNGTP